MRKKNSVKKEYTINSEFNYFVNSDFSAYKGQYVALLDKKVIASGENAKEVWRTALKRSAGKLPTLAKLPQEEVLCFYGNRI